MRSLFLASALLMPLTAVALAAPDVRAPITGDGEWSAPLSVSRPYVASATSVPSNAPTYEIHALIKVQDKDGVFRTVSDARVTAAAWTPTPFTLANTSGYVSKVSETSSKGILAALSGPVVTAERDVVTTGTNLIFTVLPRSASTVDVEYAAQYSKLNSLEPYCLAGRSDMCIQLVDLSALNQQGLAHLNVNKESVIEAPLNAVRSRAVVANGELSDFAPASPAPSALGEVRVYLTVKKVSSL
jgi:hypothetical protein